MKMIISGKNFTITEGLRQHIEQKLSKLERYFKPDTEVQVTLQVEKNRNKVEVTIPLKGHIIRSEQTSGDMYASIDMIEEVLERQLRKYRNKLVAKHPEHSFKQEFLNETNDTEEEDSIRIIRTKKFGIKPMYPEDACMQMELLGHSFFVFHNAQTDSICVVYKRKDGAYGLIEPEFS